ncbi:hypothetical protein T492DRAFT_855494 [Pavlovales sp. CCMP2436]|nr:hypothetical protein T492DRAFT_855494 [Pavlovales sp. CCMP2436]
MSGLPAVAGASEPPSKPDPGNPITEQNLLYNIKSFAADAAYSDDRARSLAQVMLIMETQEEDKARKSLAEAARDKVSAAVFNFKRANEKPRLEAKSAVEKGRLPTTADKKAHEAAAAADEFQTLEELLMERRLLMRLGCFEEAHVYEKRIEAARERREKKRVEMNKHVLEKKLAGLEMKQRHEIKELITLQEYHELFEAVTKAAASALRTLAKQRYRMSKDLLSMKDSQAKLLEVGRDMQAKEMAEGARKKPG